MLRYMYLQIFIQITENSTLINLLFIAFNAFIMYIS